MTDSEYLENFNRELWRALRESGESSLSRIQRDSLCVSYFQLEVNNGGIHQYLFNSSGDLAKETPDVFRRIGADQAASILEEANAFFGQNGPPTERDARIEVLLSFPEAVESRIDALTKAFFKEEDNGLVLADLFDAYVLSKRV